MIKLCTNSPRLLRLISTGQMLTMVWHCAVLSWKNIKMPLHTSWMQRNKIFFNTMRKLGGDTPGKKIDWKSIRKILIWVMDLKIKPKKLRKFSVVILLGMRQLASSIICVTKMMIPPMSTTSMRQPKRMEVFQHTLCTSKHCARDLSRLNLRL
jgi:hypothetical protein